MNESVSVATSDVLEYLMRLGEERPSTDEAQSKLRTIQARHPGIKMDLIWEREAFDQSLHFDVLLRPPGGRTVSISVASEIGLPWPLRGVKRSTDANLLQVNGRMLTMEEAATFLDVLWNEAPLMQRMVDACLLREELEREPIVLTDEEMQLGVDGLRRTHNLLTAEDTIRWMKQRGLTQERLEQQVAGHLMCARVRARVAQGRVESYFESHRHELETLRVATFECRTETDAQRIHALVKAHETSPQQLERAGVTHVRFMDMRRRDTKDDGTLGAAIPDDVLGPTRVAGGFELRQVLARNSATLDPETRVTIEHILFDEWLSRRRETAQVCWHWGHANEPTTAS